MKNIIFSTTRQWNPGDELIMAGVVNVFRELGERYNPVIFNRNPDVRSTFQDLQLFKNSRVPQEFVQHPDLRMLESNLRIGFFDNSLKPNTDCSFADWVVFAGTPEWCNGRTYDLYHHILRHNIPVMILGVGNALDVYEPCYLDVIRKAKVFTVRDEATLRSAREAGLDAIPLACPALLSARSGKERRVEQVKKIGLIYQATQAESVIMNGCSEATYDWQMRLHRELIREYGKSFEFGIVCHYIDELPLAEKEFPDHEVLYSYCADDYLDIYSQFDLVIGLRVHGIGAAASLGVPGVALAHDFRGSTSRGFLADVVSCEDTDMSTALNMVERSLASVPEKSAALIRHKAETMETYKGLVSRALLDANVDYGSAKAGRQTGREIDLQTLADIAKLVFALQEAADSGNRRGRGSEMASAALRALDDLAEAQRRNDDLLNSTSWRMTGPVRALARLRNRITLRPPPHNTETNPPYQKRPPCSHESGETMHPSAFVKKVLDKLNLKDSPRPMVNVRDFPAQPALAGGTGTSGWGSSAFDSQYYHSAARGGFKEYVFDSPIQRDQLSIKFNQIAFSGIQYKSILFVGCAKGFEVKYWLSRGYDAYGVDVSEFAIRNCEPEVRDRVMLYDGADLSRFKDGQFDLVCFFDVMALVPEEIRGEFISEVSRVAKKGIIFRTHIVNPREPLLDNEFHGQDGAWYKYWTFERYVESFERPENNSTLQGCSIAHQCESVFYFKKRTEPMRSLAFPNFAH